MTQASPGSCIVCHQISDVVPLVRFRFRGAEHWICTQHLPVLIHQPHALAEHLPGSEGLAPAEHQD